jgi:hypothetical protein
MYKWFTDMDRMIQALEKCRHKTDKVRRRWEYWVERVEGATTKSCRGQLEEVENSDL